MRKIMATLVLALVLVTITNTTMAKADTMWTSISEISEAATQIAGVEISAVCMQQEDGSYIVKFSMFQIEFHTETLFEAEILLDGEEYFVNSARAELMNVQLMVAIAMGF